MSQHDFHPTVFHFTSASGFGSSTWPRFQIRKEKVIQNKHQQQTSIFTAPTKTHPNKDLKKITKTSRPSQKSIPKKKRRKKCPQQPAAALPPALFHTLSPSTPETLICLFPNSSLWNLFLPLLLPPPTITTKTTTTKLHPVRMTILPIRMTILSSPSPPLSPPVDLSEQAVLMVDMC